MKTVAFTLGWVNHVETEQIKDELISNGYQGRFSQPADLYTIPVPVIM